jgi:hypothetical protein
MENNNENIDTKVIPNTQVPSPPPKPSSVDTTRTIFNWILQIILWICLYYMYIDLINANISTPNLVFTFIFYLAYLINNLIFSSTNSYLDHVVKLSNMKIYMNKLFKSPIEKKFKITNYHYQDAGWFSKNDKKKIVSSTDNETLQFKSWRDTSGKLNLDLTKLNKLFLRLKLEREIDFEDEEAKKSYESFVADFKKRNEGKDANMDYEEETTLQNFENYVLIKLREGNSFLLSSFAYFIFTTLIPIAEVYKYYFAKQCHYKEYKFNKSISFKNDLNSLEYDEVEKFKNSKPEIVVEGANHNFKFNEIKDIIEMNKLQIKEPPKSEKITLDVQDELNQPLL